VYTHSNLISQAVIAAKTSYFSTASATGPTISKPMDVSFGCLRGYIKSKTTARTLLGSVRRVTSSGLAANSGAGNAPV